MGKLDGLLENLIGSEVESLIQEDDYYQVFATPLKPASAFKAAHRKQLIEFFKLTELKKELELAPDLILNKLPEFLTGQEFEKIKLEFDQSGDHFVHYIEKMEGESEKPILFQEMFGLSDDTLLKIYDLAVNYVEKQEIEKAKTLFVFLTTLAPHVKSYWIAQGACLQGLNRHEEAIAVFTAAKFLNPEDPAPSFYIIESQLALKESENAKLEFDLFKDLVNRSSGDEKAKWMEEMKKISLS